MENQPKIDTEKVKEHIKRKWYNPYCPMCKTENWIIPDTMFELKEHTGGRIIHDRLTTISPVIMVTCGNCGNTLLLNAMVVGIFDPNAYKG